MRHLARQCVVLVWVAICVRPAVAEPLILVQDGRPAATIVVAPNPTPAARLAAMELRHHIQLITGATLPVLHPGDAITGVPILVGESELTRRQSLRGVDFQTQEYLIRIKDGTIVLMGRDWTGTEAERKDIGCDTNFRSLADWRNKINYAETVGSKDADESLIELPGALDEQGTCY